MNVGFKNGCLAQLVRATRLHRVGYRFESYSTHHVLPTKSKAVPFQQVRRVKNVKKIPYFLPTLVRQIAVKLSREG